MTDQTDLQKLDKQIADLQKHVSELEPLAARVSDLSSQVVDLTKTRDVATGELATVRDVLAKSEATIDGLTNHLKVAEETITTHGDTAGRFTKLQEEHTSLQTRHQDGIKDRLKVRGLSEELYRDRSIDQLEAMEVALGNVKLVAPSNGNPPANEANAGLGGGSGAANSAPATGLQSEEDMYAKARARNNTPSK